MTDTTHAHEPAEHGHDDHGVGHVVPLKYLVANGIALLILTVVTVAAAKVDFGRFQLAELNIWVAMAIASLKASLVVLFFMHLRWDRPFHAVVFVVSIALVALFIGFAMTDTFAYDEELEAYADAKLVRGEAETVADKLDAAKAVAEEQAAHGDDHGGDGH